MLMRLLFALFLLIAASGATATDYTDIYFVALEPGSGYNVVQSDTFMFITFFIYGPPKSPTWYTAQLTQDASGNFNGPLYATTGTYYGMTWNVQDQTITQVGTASFQPTSPYTANLIYTVTTPPPMAATVNKALQRQTLTPITIGGTYVGGQSGAYSGCTNSANNGPYSDYFDLQVTQLTSGSVTFQFDYLFDNPELTCTFTGTLVQYGQLYTVPSANYSCSDGLNTTASMSEIRATSLGIEGRYSAPNVGGGCREDATFGGPLH
ncbi:MAG TPA: hypothetical protein VEN29_22085 [Casimicrobiaceae bacterium]|nr:hypothetical protein [Casimicrobiaceae bacterium]